VTRNERRRCKILFYEDLENLEGNMARKLRSKIYQHEVLLLTPAVQRPVRVPCLRNYLRNLSIEKETKPEYKNNMRCLLFLKNLRNNLDKCKGRYCMQCQEMMCLR